jgi:hypothetical protein
MKRPVVRVGDSAKPCAIDATVPPATDAAFNEVAHIALLLEPAFVGQILCEP